MTARPTTRKYGANSEPASHFELGVNAVMRHQNDRHDQAAAQQPQHRTQKPVHKTQTGFFMIQRASLPAIPAATSTAKKMIRKPAISASQADFR